MIKKLIHEAADFLIMHESFTDVSQKLDVVRQWNKGGPVVWITFYMELILVINVFVLFGWILLKLNLEVILNPAPVESQLLYCVTESSPDNHSQEGH